MRIMVTCLRFGLFVGLSWLLAAGASAQFSGNGQQPVMPQQTFPGTVVPNPSQLTPQQFQSMMLMRAMQNGGRHQVKTGFPQNIPLGNNGMMGGGAPMQQMPMSAQPAASTKKSKYSKKKSDALASREEKKRAAKEAAKAKKEKASKKAKDKPADDRAAT